MLWFVQQQTGTGRRRVCVWCLIDVCVLHVDCGLKPSTPNCLEPWVPLLPGVNYIDEGSSSVIPVFIFDLPYPGEWQCLIRCVHMCSAVLALQMMG